MLEFRDIKELENLMSEEQKLKAKQDYERFTAFARDEEGNFIDVPCISFDDGGDYLTYVDLKDFD